MLSVERVSNLANLPEWKATVMNGQCADVVEVSQIVNRWFTAADAGDFDTYRDLLAEEVRVDFGGINDTGGDSEADGVTTRNELTASAKRVVGPVALTQHMITNIVADIDGDEARVTFYEAALHVHPELGEDPKVNSWTLFGRGEHGLRRLADGWRIVYTRLTPTHHTGNANLLADVARLSR
jgi:hypothetical protein